MKLLDLFNEDTFFSPKKEKLKEKAINIYEHYRIGGKTFRLLQIVNIDTLDDMNPEWTNDELNEFIHVDYEFPSEFRVEFNTQGWPIVRVMGQTVFYVEENHYEIKKNTLRTKICEEVYGILYKHQIVLSSFNWNFVFKTTTK